MSRMRSLECWKTWWRLE